TRQEKTICSVLLQSDGCSVVEAHDSDERSFMQMNTGNSSLRLTTKDPFQFKKWHDALLASLHAVQQQPNMPAWESQLSLDGSLNCGGQMRWRKDKLLARGGGGSVFRGSVQLNSADWQRCVIKVIRLPMEAGADGCEDCTTGIRRAVDGEQNLCDLSHQNIVQFLGIVQTVDQFKVCLFMELLDGDTLESIIGGNPMTDQSQMRSICGQICSAMQYIHTRQPPVIH
uniref:Protein kinase domain-containing protein n=1 Tax=Macrostomum lignano TaxID=282301 RepID=A0A1I8H3I2_9PLAT